MLLQVEDLAKKRKKHFVKVQVLCLPLTKEALLEQDYLPSS